MIHGYLPNPGTYVGLERHPVWKSALDWLRSLPADLALGEYEIRGREQYVSVQEYATLPAAEARFESHEHYVDLQYTLGGAEAVDWLPRSELVPDGPFTRDVQFWLPPAKPLSQLVQTAGRFVIFFPEDAHRPKVAVPGHPQVRKLVIKTALSLVQ